MSGVRAGGIVVRGHRVASGACGDPRFPAGTIAAQLPFFAALIPGFAAYLRGPAHPGTINLRFAARRVRILRPEHHLRAIAWTAAFPPEDFFLARSTVTLGGVGHPAYAYIPDPRTKPDHHQAADVVELLARFIPGLAYGDRAELACAATALAIEPAD